MAMTNSRWTNWDALSDQDCGGGLMIGDLWDIVDRLEGRRQHAAQCAPAIAEIDRRRLAELERKKIDMAQFMADEPYAEMCNKPRRVNHQRPTGRNAEARKHAAEDKQIIADHRLEIEKILREKPRSQSDIARDFGVSINVLRRVIKGWDV